MPFFSVTSPAGGKEDWQSTQGTIDYGCSQRAVLWFVANNTGIGGKKTQEFSWVGGEERKTQLEGRRPARG